MFEIVIAYIAVVISLSTVVTAVLDLASAIGLRFLWLKSTISRLLESLGVEGKAKDEEWKRFRADILVNPGGRWLPTQVSDDAMVRWLRGEGTNKKVRTNFEALSDAETLAWVTGFSKASTRGFKGLMFLLGTLVGGILVWCLGLDAIGLADHLQRRPEDVSSLVRLAADDKTSRTDTGATNEVRRYLEFLDEALVEELESSETRKDQDEDIRRELQVALMLEAREVVSAAKPATWERAEDLVSDHYFTLRRNRVLDGEPKHWLEAANKAIRSLADDESSSSGWRPAFLTAFRAGLPTQPPNAEFAAHGWLKTILAKLTGESTLADFAATLTTADVRRVALIEATDLAAAASASAAAKKTMEVFTRDYIGFSGIKRAEEPWARFLGTALFALLIGLGAPFWFDVLTRVNRAARVRKADKG